MHPFWCCTYKILAFLVSFRRKFLHVVVILFTWFYFLFQSRYYRSPEVLLGYPYPYITTCHDIICLDLCLNFLPSLSVWWHVILIQQRLFKLCSVRETDLQHQLVWYNTIQAEYGSSVIPVDQSLTYFVVVLNLPSDILRPSICGPSGVLWPSYS